MGWRILPFAIWLVASLLISGLTHACIPASKKLTGPLACPAGTTEYVVWRHFTRTSNGKSSETSDLICIDQDGGGTNAGTLRPIAVGTMYTATLLGIPLAFALLAGRRRRRKAGAASTVGLLALVFLTGCPWGTVSSDELDKRYPYHQGTLLSRGVMVDVVKKLEARVGTPVTVTGLSISAGSVVFLVRDAKKPSNVDSWMYDGEEFSTQPSQTERERNLDDESFTLTGLPFAKIHDLVVTALGKLAIDAGHASSVSFHKFSDGVRINVDVEGPRQRGRAVFNARGELVNAEID